MSWQDRDYNKGGGGAGGSGGHGGDWKGMRPSFDNPMSWSIPIGRYFGIDVRMHFFLLFYMLIRLFGSFGEIDAGVSLPLGPFFAVISIGGLFFIVLIHEFGHCFACRSTGGSANEILMWPLGGLAYCMPPHKWKAHLWTVAGGPLVNVVLAIIFAAILGPMTGYWWRVAFPIPISTMMPISFIANENSAWLLGLYFIAEINMMLLLFNLLPMFPLDGGRAVQAVLWSKVGYVKSMRLSVRVGYIAAIAMGLLGIIVKDFFLVGIAAFGGITCWMTYKQLAYTEEVMGFAYDDYAQKLQDEYNKESQREPSKRELKRTQKLEEVAKKNEQELDRLLKKIADKGMGSLSSRERRWLESQSKERKKSG